MSSNILGPTQNAGEKTPAPPKTFGYFNTAYIEMSPPIELPAVNVFLASLSVLYLLSINGLSLFTKNSTYFPPSPALVLLLVPLKLKSYGQYSFSRLSPPLSIPTTIHSFVFNPSESMASSTPHSPEKEVASSKTFCPSCTYNTGYFLFELL